MTTFIAGIAVALLATGCGGGSSRSLPTFESETGAQTKLGVTIRPPYTSMNSFYGFVEKGQEPDEKREGKNFYYLYVWVPAYAPELGLRMISPVPGDLSPAEGDFVGGSWEANNADRETFFDTYITFERAAGLSADGIKGAATASWKRIDWNDDSSELPPQPDGRNYNSVLRIESNRNDPLRSLVRGLYRIGFTTFKRGEVQGSFLAQIGAPIDLPGVVIGRTPAEVHAKVNGK
jgi:hypothetical protein